MLRPIAVGIAAVLILWGLQVAAQPAETDFVGSAACQSCHSAEYTAWADSHHGWALRTAKPENVLGDFNNLSVELEGIEARFFRRGDSYFTELSEGDGKTSEHQIRYTVGVEPLQQYLVATRDGRLQPLDLAWDTRQRRWFHLYPDAVVGPGDGFHWTGPYKNWQARCASCHQTDFTKNYDQRSDGYASTWSDLTVGCESCHGAGAAHTAWAQNPDRYDPRKFTNAGSKGLLVDFLTGREGQAGKIGICAGCHSRREALEPDSAPIGSAYDEHFNLALLRSGTYHPDGQINDEVYVFGSFVQSRMYANGVSCGDCHEPHSGALVAEGNAVCTQCHNPEGREEFSTLLLADYEAVDHHRHQPDSAGAQCVSCHMPAKNFMVVDPRRDHSFRVPRPDLTVAIGTPNACGACHENEGAQWAADKLVQWFPDGRSGQPHFGEILKVARAFDDPQTANRLAELAADESLAAIVRATAVAGLSGRIDEQRARLLLPLLDDSEPLIRAAAVRAFQSAPASFRGRFVAGLMNDGVRIVRQEAARATLDLPTADLDQEQLKIVTDARGDYQKTLLGRIDFPETHLQIAGLAMIRRNLSGARAALEAAVNLDPQLVDAWMTLGRVAFALDGAEATAALMQTAVENNPDTAILRQSLGNALVELGRFDMAREALETARSLEPGAPSIPLDLARLELAGERTGAAVAHLERARDTGTLIPETLEMLAVIYAQQGDLAKATTVALELGNRFPLYQPGPEVGALLDLAR